MLNANLEAMRPDHRDAYLEEINKINEAKEIVAQEFNPLDIYSESDLIDALESNGWIVNERGCK